jgi:hypothetical protein
MYEHACSTTEAPIHTCQWLNKPLVIAKLPAHFRSAAIRHAASNPAVNAIGGSNEATASARR